MYFRKFTDLLGSITGKSSYINYDIGEIPLILTNPHGGGVKPFFIPNRKYGKTLQDTYTRRLTYKILDLMNYTPYYLLSDIHRVKVDHTLLNYL